MCELQLFNSNYSPFPYALLALIFFPKMSMLSRLRKKLGQCLFFLPYKSCNTLCTLPNEIEVAKWLQKALFVNILSPCSWMLCMPSTLFVCLTTSITLAVFMLARFHTFTYYCAFLGPYSYTIYFKYNTCFHFCLWFAI